MCPRVPSRNKREAAIVTIEAPEIDPSGFHDLPVSLVGVPKR